MSADEYQRVTDARRVAGFWAPDPDGTHKVVPADAIVIERGEVPEVKGEPGDLYVAGFSFHMHSADDAHEEAVRWLAVAEHLRANPPVDEEQAERLAALILEVDVPVNNGPEWPTSWARDLVRRGVRVEVTP